MAVTVGAIYVDVLPSTRDFVKQMVGEILPEADKAGEEIGKRVGKELGKEAGQAARKGIEEGIDDADTEKKAGKKGKTTGAAFARTFQAEVRTAIEALPDIDLESDPEGVLADIALIRKELQDLSGKKIGVDLSGQGAIAQARALREQLANLRDVELDLDVNFDLDAATAALGQLERQIAQKVGGTFDNTLRRSLSSAIETLPEIELDIDEDSPLQSLGKIRAELEAFRDIAEIDLDINGGQALADVARISAGLQALVDDESVDIKIRVDAKAAIANLEAVQTAANGVKKEIVEVEREIGAFARSIRSSLDSALRSLPEITLDANTDPARAKLQDIREELAAFRSLEIGVDLSTAEALRGTEIVRAQLISLRDDAKLDIEVRANAARVVTELDKILALAEIKGEEIGQAIEESIDDGVDRGLSGFGRKIRDTLAKAAATLPDIPINANTDPARVQVQSLRDQLDVLSAAIGVEVTAAEAYEELATLTAAAELLDREDVDIDVRVDLRGIIAQLTALTAAAVVAEVAVDDAVGAKAAGRMSHFRLILVAVVALFPLIAGAVFALAGALATVATPIGAIAVGVDGIKTAFAGLQPQVESLKKAVSETFEKGLEPAVANVAKLFPTVQTGLVDTADALSEVAIRVSDVASSSENLDTMASSFDLINDAVRSASPSIEILTENVINLTTVGARGLVGFGEEMRQVGVAWQGVIDRLSASGSGESAVRSLLQVLAELLNLTAGLTEFGTVLMAAFGPALATVISTLAAVFSTLAEAVDSLPEPLQTIVGIATTVGLIFLALGTRVGAAATAMRVGMVTALGTLRTAFTTTRTSVVTFGTSLTGLGVASRIAAPAIAGVTVAARGLLMLLGGPIGLAITGIVTVLSFLGQAQADAAQRTDEHKAAAEELANALRASGYAIDSNILNLTRHKLEGDAAAEAMKALGLSQDEVAKSIAHGGPSYDQLVAQLTGLAEQTGVSTVRGQFLTAQQREQKQAASELLGAITPLRQEFKDAWQKARDLGTALFETGMSMVDGVGSASALEKAFGTLKDQMSSVEDKAKALYEAVLLLTGQSLPLGLAQGKLGEAARDLTAAFDEMEKAVGKGSKAVLDHSGNISVASQAGYELVQATDDLVKSMTSAATAAFENAGGMNNVERATAAAKREAEFAREAFIKQANEIGITGKAAEELADRYGLIPELVVTILKTQGLPQVQQDLLMINQLVRDVPLNTTVNIGVPAKETIDALKGIGAEIVNLPDGEFGIILKDEKARENFTKLVQSVEHPPAGPPKMPVQLSVEEANAQARYLAQGIGDPPSGPVQMPVGLGTGQVPGQVQGVQNTVGGAPATMPTTLDTTKVQPQLDAVKQSALTTVAMMPVDPIKGSGWDGLLLGIKNSVLTTVAQMPIDAMQSVNFAAQLEYIRTTVRQGAPAPLPIDAVKAISFDSNLGIIRQGVGLPPYTQLPIDVVKAPSFDSNLGIIKQSITLPPYVALPIDVAKSPTFDINLNAIKQSLLLPPYAVLPIDVVKAISFDSNLGIIKQGIGLPPYALLPIDVAKSINFDLQLQGIRDSVALTPAVILVTADGQAFVDWINSIYAFIAANPLVFLVTAEATAFVDWLNSVYVFVGSNPLVFIAEIDPSYFVEQLSILLQPQILPIYAVIMGIGGGLGMASGGIVGRNPAFDAASEASQRLRGGGGPVGNSPPSSRPPGGGLFNPGADLDPGLIDDLRNANGNFVSTNAMSSTVAKIVGPNTWRIIGDRPVGDEAFIPINSSRRSQQILAITAQRMGYSLSPQATGSFMAQQSSAFNGSTTWAGDGAAGDSTPLWTSGGAPLIGQVVAERGASATDLADEVMFRLRTSRYGGPHGGRR